VKLSDIAKLIEAATPGWGKPHECRNSSQPFHLTCATCKAVNYVTRGELGRATQSRNYELVDIHVLHCRACKSDTYFGEFALKRFAIKKDAP
jgi:hypothetical protein